MRKMCYLKVGTNGADFENNKHSWARSFPLLRSRVSYRAFHRRHGLRELLRVHTGDGEVPVPEAS